MTPVAIAPAQPSAAKPADASRPSGPDAEQDTEFSNVLADSLDAGGPKDEVQGEAEDLSESETASPADLPASTVAPGTAGAPAEPQASVSANPLTAALAAEADFKQTKSAVLDNAGDDAASGASPAGVDLRNTPGSTGQLVAASGLQAQAKAAPGPTATGLQATTSSDANPGATAATQVMAGGEEVNITETLEAALPSFETLLAEAGHEAGRSIPGAGSENVSASTGALPVHNANTPRIGFGPTPWEPPGAVSDTAIRSPIGESAWAGEAGGVVRVMIEERVPRAEVRIDPPELGPIEIHVAMDGDSTSITFHAAMPETRALIEGHMQRLREALAGAGIELGNASVQAGLQGDSRETSSSPNQPPADRDRDGAERTVNASLPRTRLQGVRLIDVFA